MMKIDFKPFLFGMTSPVWAPADDGASGGGSTSGNDTALGGDAGDQTTGDDKSTEEGSTEGQTGKTVLDGDEGDDAGNDADDGASDDTKDGDDKRTDEEKEADAKAEEVPEDGVYEFDLPDGVTLPDEDKAAWSERFKEMGLTRKQAQSLIEAQSAQVVAEQKAYADFIEKQQADHQAAAKADKDIGGDKWGETVKLANIALTALRGGPKKDSKDADGNVIKGKPEGALESLILTSGNGNNPEMLRELRRIGKAYANDSFAQGNTHEEPQDTATSWYGDTTPEKKKG